MVQKKLYSTSSFDICFNFSLHFKSKHYSVCRAEKINNHSKCKRRFKLFTFNSQLLTHKNILYALICLIWFKKNTIRFFPPIYKFSKKSFPLSSVIIKAGKFLIVIFRTASIPISSKSTTSTEVIFSFAKIAAGPPIEPK